MVGIVGSGKSTYAKELAEKENAVIHSSDDLRVELFGDVMDQVHNDIIFKELHRRIHADLKVGKNVCYDSTNIGYKKRIATLLELRNYDVEKIAIVMATPYEDCLLRNQQRERKVPEWVMKKMYMNFTLPQLREGFSEIKFVWSFDSSLYNADHLIKRLCNIRQDNKHHKLSIGYHCIACKDNLKEQDANLQLAGLLHDIGKEKTKKFEDGKGNPTMDAHYYGHASVSAYDAIFYLKGFYECSDEDILYICALIVHHMQMYNLESEKAKKKFIKLVGKELYEKLLILNNADINAH